MSLAVMQIVEGSRVLKKWFGKNVSGTAIMTDLFGQFSRGELDNGSAIPKQLIGCKVVSMISSELVMIPLK